VLKVITEWKLSKVNGEAEEDGTRFRQRMSRRPPPILEKNAPVINVDQSWDWTMEIIDNIITTIIIVR
jgi:hypothetical protein